ncbi:MAG: hypothetical protein R2715_08975 [Ilumatobacteraceae bacterium]
MERGPWRSILAPILAIGAVSACSSSSESAVDTTSIAGVDTSVDLSTIPVGDAVVPAVRAQILDDVPLTIGVVLSRAQRDCVSAALAADVDPDALMQMGYGGSINDQFPLIQSQIFGAFDRCIPPAEYGRTAAPILMNAGVDEEAASCVFRTMAESLGFAGLYRYASTTAGELDAVSRSTRHLQCLRGLLGRSHRVDGAGPRSRPTPPPPPFRARVRARPSRRR